MESRLADEGEVSDDSSGQHNRGRAKALWAEVVQGVGRTLEHAARPTTPMERGRVPPSERRRRSTSGREARVGRDRAVRLAAAGNADAERHTSASSRTGEKPMSGYSGAGRKRGHAATAPARYPLLPHPSREVDSGGSVSWYKPKAKSGAVRRESERGIVPRIVETTQLGVGKAAHFGDARAARDGRGHG